MTLSATTDELTAILPSPSKISVDNMEDKDGIITIFTADSPIKLQSGETTILITPEGIEMEAPDISLTAEAAVEVEAGADFDLTVGGAVEVESSDISITALAVEVEAALFTVA
jgi:hypothetical protein